MPPREAADMRLSGVLAVFGAIVVVVLVMGGPLYTVQEWQQVVITEFGRPVGEPVTEAGLHWKTPFIQRARYMDRTSRSEFQ